MKKLKKYLYFFIIIIISAGIIYQATNIAKKTVLSTSTQVINWGTHFTQEGQKPQGNASEEYLREFDSYFVAQTEEKIIYLTFDAGYENGYTSKILDILKEQNISAAFFLTGHYIKTNPDLVKRMVSEGHIVGNHTMTHPDMSAITNLNTFRKELEELETLFYETTNTSLPKFYRPPSGKFSEENLNFAKSLGYKTIFWSVAYGDWDNNNQPTAQVAFDKLIPRIHPGAIVLLHCTSKTNSEILSELLKKYKDMGYSFHSLNELE